MLKKIFRRNKQAECNNPNLIGGVKSCESQRVRNVYKLARHPKVFMFNIAWSITGTEMSKMSDTLKLLHLLPNLFEPRSLFSTVEDCSSSKTFFFKGMVCFWGSHYFAYFRDFDSATPQESWKLYDDQRIQEVGSWHSVLSKTMRGRERPILLLFEELQDKNEVSDANRLHSLNESITEDQWKHLFETAKEADDFQESLKKQEDTAIPGQAELTENLKGADPTLGMNAKEMEEQMKILL